MRKGLIVLAGLTLILGGCSVMDRNNIEYKYNHPGDISFDDYKQLESELSKKGDALVSQLGPIEDEYNLMNSLVHKFINQISKEFPGRKVETDLLEKSRRLGDFWRGKMSNDGRAHSQQWSDENYVIGIEDINNPQTIERFWEIAKSIFEPAGFKGGEWLPTRKMSSGYVGFDWVFVKPSGVSDPHIRWKNESTIRVSGENALVVGLSTDTRFMKDDLKKYRAAAASTTSTATNQK